MPGMFCRNLVTILTKCFLASVSPRAPQSFLSSAPTPSQRILLLDPPLHILPVLRSWQTETAIKRGQVSRFLWRILFSHKFLPQVSLETSFCAVRKRTSLRLFGSDSYPRADQLMKRCSFLVGFSLVLLCVTPMCIDGGPNWRQADEPKMERLMRNAADLTDEIAANPLNVDQLLRLEVMCKDHGEQNSRFRILQTIDRIDPGVADFIGITRAYALGDRTYWHAKACRFDEREKNFLALNSLWRIGAWDNAMQQYGLVLPVLPLYSLVFDFDMEQVTAISRAWAEKFASNAHREKVAEPFTNPYLKYFSDSRRLKVGYVSSDIYRVHPVGKSVNALLRMLDPSLFEVYGFLLLESQLHEAENLEEGTGGVMLMDLSIMSSAEAASAINEEGLHILIDLNGHTSGVRMEIFVHQPAPIAMHYMGYGATIGAEYINYFLADKVAQVHKCLRLIRLSRHGGVSATPELSVYYTEKLVYLPPSFYATSYRYDPRLLPWVERNSSFRDERASVDLPRDGNFRYMIGLSLDSLVMKQIFKFDSFPHNPGVVLCNFNHLHKTSRRMWRHWAEILNRTEDSVLWTLNDSEETKVNIAKELRAFGIAEDRIRYADHEKIWQHLHRHTLADLFLDNNEYNGGTTGLDAYWADVPIISAPLEKFSARYGASFNAGAGLELLTARGWDDYVDIAAALVDRRGIISRMRQMLQISKLRSRLFDTEAFALRYGMALKLLWEIAWAEGGSASTKRMHSTT